MNPVLKQLIVKDVRLNLPFMTMMVVTGVVGLIVMAFGRTGFALGGILYITASIAGGIFIGMICILQERKDQSSLFTLSLPVSVQELSVAKFAAALIVYGLPWLTLAAAVGIAYVLRTDVPRGILVYALMLHGSFLAVTVPYFAVISVARSSEAAAGLSILFLNMGFSLFMMWNGQPGIADPLRTNHIVWTTPALASLAIEATLVVGALVLGFLLLSRRREIF